MSDAEDPIPRSDLTVRFAAGVVMVAVATLAITLGGWPFRALVLAGAAVTLLEWADMHRVPRLWAWFGAVFLAVNLLAVTEWLYPAGQVDAVAGPSGEMILAVARESFDPARYGFAAALGLGLLLGLFSRRVAMGWGYVYVAVPSFALLVLSWADIGLVFWVMIVTWATDIFAYFAGRSIGGPKLAPKISPNKTWAGLIGGMAGAGALGWLTADWFELGSPFTWLGAAMGAVAQAGDLYESRVKRRLGVKDSGTILPGHGGVLDRIDGLLAVAAATMALVMAGLWTG